MNPRYADRKTKVQMLSELKLSEEAAKAARMIARATLQFTNSEGWNVIRYHHTNVVEKRKDMVRLNSGGWRTPTTKSRMNEHSEGFYCVYSGKRGWEVSIGKRTWDSERGEWIGETQIVSFYDGMGINIRTGRLAGGKAAERKANASVHREAALKAKIIKFANRLKTEPVPNVSAGDCFYCQMREAGTGKDVLPHDCVLLHVKENYLHGSLVVRAIQASGRNPAFWYRPGAPSKEIARILRRYLYTVCGVS